MLCFMLSTGVFDVAVRAISPCSVGDFGSREALKDGRCVKEFFLVGAVHNSATCIASLLCMVLLFGKVWHIVCSYIAEERLIRKGHSSSSSTTPDDERRARYSCCYWLIRQSSERRRGGCRAGWVTASSPDLFNETAVHFQAFNVVTGLVVLPCATLRLLAQLHSALVNWEADLPDQQKACGGGGGDGEMTLCVLGSKLSALLICLNAALAVTVNMAIHTQTVRLWSYHTRLAQRKRKERRMANMMSLPWLGSLAYVGLACQMALHANFNLRGDDEKRPAQGSSLFLFGAGLTVYLTAVLFHTRIPQDIGAVLFVSIRNLIIGNRFVSSCRRVSQIDDGANDNNSINEQGARNLLPQSSANEGVRVGLVEMLRNSDIGVEEKQIVMLMLQILLWGQRGLGNVQLSETVLNFVMRIVAMAALFLVSDRRSSFEDLKGNSCSFGLVVDARKLRKAIRSRPGRRLSSPLPMYKATLSRMQETLAISYRWQPEEVEVAPECFLNMKPFQLEAVSEAIASSGARYVWLDRLSVPQEDSGQKQTLLARMMGIYSAATWTLSIRTSESPGSRYHQRAWTLQEFCCAGHLQVVTEPADPRSSMAVAAVEANEGDEIFELRRQFHQQHCLVLPLWLRQEGTNMMAPAQAREILRQYRELSALLQCLMPGDMVRALLPLLARCPVESQRELVTLVDILGRYSGEDVYSLKRALFDRYLHNKGIKSSRDMSGRGWRQSGSDDPNRKTLMTSYNAYYLIERSSSSNQSSNPEWISSRPDLSVDESSPAAQSNKVDKGGNMAQEPYYCFIAACEAERLHTIAVRPSKITIRQRCRQQKCVSV